MSLATSHPYDYTFSPDDGSTAARVAQLVVPGSRVLELGCGFGSITRVLRARDCAVTAVELDPAMASAAEPYCDRLLVGDIEDPALLGGLEPAFDAIIMADVLEHLRNPGKTVYRLMGWLAKGGALVISVPNIGYFGVICEILRGDFRYRDGGILDSTHLRFFTWQSLERLLNEEGFEVNQRFEIRAPHGHEEFQTHQAALPEQLVNMLKANPESQVYQYVCRAIPSGDPQPYPSTDAFDHDTWQAGLRHALGGEG